jgi:hypothetical protein
MLATFTVMNDDDAQVGTPAAVGTLRQAIFDADQTLAADTIRFDASLADAVITLTQGELSITRPVEITGTDAGGNVLGITIDAGDGADGIFNTGDGFRAVNITGGDTTLVTLNHLTFTGGDVTGNGGAILSTASLTLKDSLITGNAAIKGGGVAVNVDGYYGRVNIERTSFRGNAVYGGALNGGYGGGAYLKVEDLAQLTISHSTFTQNEAVGIESNAAGLAVLAAGATVTIDHVRVIDNAAADDIGGLYIKNTNGTVTMTHSTVSGITADEYCLAA